MTAPHGETPDKAYTPATISSMQNVKQSDIGLGQTADLRNILSTVGDSFFAVILSGFASIGAAIGQALDDVANALFGGIIANDHPALERIRDGQLDLRNRIDLFDELSGYGCGYMKENRYKTRRTWHLMEFNGLLGPEPKNCIFRDHMFILAKGTWEVSVMLTHDQHGGGTIQTRVEVIYPEGDPRITNENEGVYSYVEHHSEIHQNMWLSIPVSMTAVCPEPGYRVRVRTRNDVPDHIAGIYSRLLWRGGTALTRFSVTRMDLDATNAAVETDVPTIGSAQ